jgi:hypothetical protein
MGMSRSTFPSFQHRRRAAPNMTSSRRAVDSLIGLPFFLARASTCWVRHCTYVLHVALVIVESVLSPKNSTSFPIAPPIRSARRVVGPWCSP